SALPMATDIWAAIASSSRMSSGPKQRRSAPLAHSSPHITPSYITGTARSLYLLSRRSSDLVGGVNVVIVEGVDVRASLPEQVGDIPVVGERVLLICGPALFAGPQLTDIDHGVQHAALAVPAADGKRGRVQRCQGLLGDYL